MFQLNEKVNRALKKANLKIQEVKDKYKNKINKKCSYCNNDIDASLTLNTTFD